MKDYNMANELSNMFSSFGYSNKDIINFISNNETNELKLSSPIALDIFFKNFLPVFIEFSREDPTAINTLNYLVCKLKLQPKTLDPFLNEIIRDLLWQISILSSEPKNYSEELCDIRKSILFFIQNEFHYFDIEHKIELKNILIKLSDIDFDEYCKTASLKLAIELDE